MQITTQQRTEIKQAINIKSAPKVTNVNFNVTVGTRIPTTVHLVPLPSRVVEIVPEYRGYDYFVWEEKIVIVDPHTHEIVVIIEV